MKNKICIIIPFYGKWPAFFPLYLESCTHNPQIDVLFLSDLRPPENCPANVKFIHMDLGEIQQRATRRLGLEVNLTRPYKLCDLRPAFAFIFPEIIKGYTFWGHGDIDVIYGDISSFLTEDIINRYDVISNNENYISGSFALFRNIPVINTLFLESSGYKKAFTASRNMGFDECNCLWAALGKGADILKADKDQSMTYLVKAAQLSGTITAYFENNLKETISSGDYVKRNKGRIFQKDGKEFLLYHFIWEKMRLTFSYPSWKNIPEKYFIDRTGFYRPEIFKTWVYYPAMMLKRVWGPLRWARDFREFARKKLVFSKLWEICVSRV